MRALQRRRRILQGDIFMHAGDYGVYVSSGDGLNGADAFLQLYFLEMH